MRSSTKMTAEWQLRRQDYGWRYQAASHEAGHTVMYFLNGWHNHPEAEIDVVDIASIPPEELTTRYMRENAQAGHIRAGIPLVATDLERARYLLAGECAECVMSTIFDDVLEEWENLDLLIYGPVDFIDNPEIVRARAHLIRHRNGKVTPEVIVGFVNSVILSLQQNLNVLEILTSSLLKKDRLLGHEIEDLLGNITIEDNSRPPNPLNASGGRRQQL